VIPKFRQPGFAGRAFRGAYAGKSRCRKQGEKVKYELIWHSVNDVHFLVEADTEEDAMDRLCIWLCDPDEENSEGIEQL
jgi:hypothetical protein